MQIYEQKISSTNNSVNNSMWVKQIYINFTIFVVELKESACVHEFSFNGFAGLFFIVDLGWLCDNQESQ